jgi:hypothetical protein
MQIQFADVGNFAAEFGFKMFGFLKMILHKYA